MLLSFDLLGFAGAGSEVTLREVQVLGAPLARPDAFSGDEDTTIAGNVMDNDLTLRSGSGAGVSISATTGSTTTTAELTAAPIHGHVSLGADGSFSYVPDANYFGADSFSYRLVDAGNGAAAGSSTGPASTSASTPATTSPPTTVTLTIRPVNDAPVAGAAQSASIVAGHPLRFDPLAGASDVDSSSLSVTWLSTPSHGTLVVLPEGGYAYTADRDFAGAETLRWLVSDGELTSSEPSSITIDVLPANTPPTASDASLLLDEDGAVQVDILSLAHDAEGDSLSARILTGPLHGSLVAVTGGGYRYTP